MFQYLQELIDFINSKETINVKVINPNQEENFFETLPKTFNGLFGYKPVIRYCSWPKSTAQDKLFNRFQDMMEPTRYEFEWIINGTPESQLAPNHIYANRKDFWSMFGFASSCS